MENKSTKDLLASETKEVSVDSMDENTVTEDNKYLQLGRFMIEKIVDFEDYDPPEYGMFTLREEELLE